MQAPFGFNVNYNCSCYLYGSTTFFTIILNTKVYMEGDKNETYHNKTVQCTCGLRQNLSVYAGYL